MFRFYIGCDFCQDWFHGTCVGITKYEADTIEEYRCPNCCKKGDHNFIELKPLTNKEIDGLKRLHRSLMVSFIYCIYMEQFQKNILFHSYTNPLLLCCCNLDNQIDAEFLDKRQKMFFQICP